MNRRIGFLFLVIAVLLTLLGMIRGGWFYVNYWLAISFLVVSTGYFKFGPAVFGKQPNGTLGWIRLPLLLPYLLYSWSVWHLFRLIKTENPHDELLPDILIGRRLLPSELPKNVKCVLDLTAEFPEPSAIRQQVKYVAYPILDAASPSPIDLIDFLQTLDRESGTLYIHCAEGHGRTGLVAAAILLQRGIATSAEDAIARVKAVRPRVRLSTAQRTCLIAVAQYLANSNPKSKPTTDH